MMGICSSEDWSGPSTTTFPYEDSSSLTDESDIELPYLGEKPN